MKRIGDLFSYSFLRPTGRMAPIALLLIAVFALSACANKPPRKKQRKRKCDCPTWNHIDLRTDECVNY